MIQSGQANTLSAVPVDPMKALDALLNKSAENSTFSQALLARISVLTDRISGEIPQLASKEPAVDPRQYSGMLGEIELSLLYTSATLTEISKILNRLETL